MPKRLTLKEVKKYFKDNDCELLETEYKNAHTLMRYRCKCKNTKCKITFGSFKNGSRCMECGGNKKLTFEFVYNYFEDHDCELLAKEYKNIHTKMRYRCKCGNKKCKITFANFSRGKRCMECSSAKKYTFKFVKQYFEDHDCKLLETEYVNAITPMKYECECENDECKISFGNFKTGQRCKKCSIERNSGKKHWKYNPNLTDEEREKGRCCLGLGKWKKDVRKKDNHSCQVCGETEGKLIAHHIENYANNKELRIVLSNGFLFCNKHHKEFHKEYGYNCNREQLNEFLEKYQKNIIISIINGIIKKKT